MIVESEEKEYRSKRSTRRIYFDRAKVTAIMHERLRINLNFDNLIIRNAIMIEAKLYEKRIIARNKC